MLKIFWNLLKTDLFLFKKTIKDKLINSFVWVIANLVISTYLLQSSGMSDSFGLFQAGSLIISMIGFELYTQVFVLISDLDGSKNISYYLTLPIPNWLLFLKYATFYFINNMFLCLAALPVIKLVLMNKIVFSLINWPIFFVSVTMASVFFAFFTLFLASIIKNVGEIENILMRILFPLWIFGGFQFSWKAALGISKFLGYLILISPYTYATEAIRSSMMNPSDFIPVWICFAVLSVMSLVAAYFGFRNLKNKLDFV